MAEPYLSIVVPCYNERENLMHGVLEEMDAYLRPQAFSYEVIVSDDGSTDDSRELVRERIESLPGFRLLENPHGNKPWAVWHGIQAARGEVVLFTDMDQSTALDQWDRLAPCFGEGYDIAIGSRGSERENFGALRQLGSWVFRTFRRLFLLRGISDTQCGFKAMRAPVARRIFPMLEAIRSPRQVTGWKVTAFDVELLFLGELAGYRIAEVSVEWANRDVSVGKGKSYVAESIEMAEQVLRVKLNHWRGEYNELINP